MKNGEVPPDAADEFEWTLTLRFEGRGTEAPASRCRRAAARSTNGAFVAAGGAGTVDAEAGISSAGAASGAFPPRAVVPPPLLPLTLAFGLRNCALRPAICSRRSCSFCSLVLVKKTEESFFSLEVSAATRGMRLDESDATEQTEQAKEGWMWTEKVVEPMRIELRGQERSGAVLEKETEAEAGSEERTRGGTAYAARTPLSARTT